MSSTECSFHITKDILIGTIREQCLLKGHNGIRGLAQVFRNMDVDFSKGIVFQELRIGMELYGIKMSERYLSALYNVLDLDGNGYIDFAEFMKALRVPLHARRVSVIMEAFDYVDVNGDEVLDIKDLKDRGRAMIESMRESCLQRGCGGIKLLSVIFRHMDTDFSKRLSRKEFEQGVAAFGMTGITKGDVEILFQYFDKDANDTIDFDEFFRQLRPPLKKFRESILHEAFERIDVNKDGVIKMDDLKVFYSANAKNHPKYLSGEWTLEETLRSFLDSIDSPDNPDGVVTREEFLDYYAGVSATIDDDSYFVMMMRACYGLPQR